MTAHFRKSDGTRLAAVLRQIAAAPDDDGIYTTDLLTPQYLAHYSSQANPRQRALTHLGASLRALEADGDIRRTGTGRGGWQRGPTQKWVITGRGLSLLTYWATDPGPIMSVREQIRGAALERRKRAADMIEEYRRQGSGPGCLRWERRILATELRAGGCSLQQIGNLFGVSGEAIRQDLRLPPAAAPARHREKVRGPAGRRLRMFRPGQTMLAQLDIITFTEW